MNEILFGINDGIAALLWYHYTGIAAMFLLFFAFLILGIVFFKNYLVAAIMFFLAFMSLLIGAPASIGAIEDRVRFIDLTDINITMLTYSPIVVITGKIKSNAMVPIQKEYFKVRITKASNNWFFNLKNYFTPIEESSFEFNVPMDKVETIPFELLVDYGNKTMPQKYNVYILYKAL
ncbi:MAG: hypothetical protein RL154_282 [Pseudomonadota bacterium]|jgi:hypothetical protein